VRKVRSQSWEGSLVNLVYGIAAGDTDLEQEFTGYYDSAGQIQAVTPTMVARLVKSSAKQVTQTLTGVGFEIEWRWIDISNDGQQVKKRTRAYCVPDSQTWNEIVSRYYYTEHEAVLPEIPDALRSRRFYRVPGAVPSVPLVAVTQPGDAADTVGTVGTLYSTRPGNNGNKPDYPCRNCGSNNWWQRDGEWLCGTCHPQPPK
jgi:hypothetical protein